MRVQRALWATGLVVALVLLPVAVRGAPVGSPFTHPPIQFGPKLSSNWAGYVVTGPPNSVTFFQGSWKQPALTCTSTTRYSYFFVGIDGYTSSTVEFGGTVGQCVGGTASYGAGYVLGSSTAAFTLTVHAGDTIKSSVTYIGSTASFRVVVADVTTGHSASHTGSVAGAVRNSAEWIVFDPGSPTVLPLADFHTAHFGTDATSVVHTCEATISGHTHVIGAFAASSIVQVKMGTLAHTKAATSALTPDDTSFNVTWKHAT